MIVAGSMTSRVIYAKMEQNRKKNANVSTYVVYVKSRLSDGIGVNYQ